MLKQEFPLHKEQLMKDFGYISFQLALANVDIIGVRLVKSYEVVIITYRAAWKTGFIYEGGNLTPEKVFRIFSDVPANWNELPEYEKNFEGKTEILYPPKHNFVFVKENQVTKINKPKK